LFTISFRIINTKRLLLFFYQITLAII